MSIKQKNRNAKRKAAIKKRESKSTTNKWLIYRKSEDYFKLYLNSEDGKPNMEYSGVWRDRNFRRMFMASPRFYQISFHLFNGVGDKALETISSRTQIAGEELSEYIYNLGREFVEELGPGHEIDYFKSYVVVRA